MEVIDILIIFLVEIDGVPTLGQSRCGLIVAVKSISIVVLLVLSIFVDFVLDVHGFKL